jgi:hypothetical protein
MTWIKSDIDLETHPKTRRLMRELGVGLAPAIGHLHLFWWWVARYAPDGDLSRFEPGDIEDAAQWTGPDGSWLRALCSAGFVDVDNDVLSVHDWCEHGGLLFERRARNAARMRNARATHLNHTDEHVLNTSRARVGLEERRGEERRGEKRREEERVQREDENLGGTPAAPSRVLGGVGVESDLPSLEDDVCELPKTKRQHKPVDPDFVAQLQAENPTVNVQEIYERAQNRAVWDGYKDKRRALRDRVAFALQQSPAATGKRQQVMASPLNDYSEEAAAKREAEYQRHKAEGETPEEREERLFRTGNEEEHPK